MVDLLESKMKDKQAADLSNKDMLNQSQYT